jgi:hypothetical protein
MPNCCHAFHKNEPEFWKTFISFDTNNYNHTHN